MFGFRQACKSAPYRLLSLFVACALAFSLAPLPAWGQMSEAPSQLASASDSLGSPDSSGDLPPSASASGALAADGASAPDAFSPSASVSGASAPNASASAALLQDLPPAASASSISFDDTYLANIATSPDYRSATLGASGFLYTGETLYALVFKSTRASVRATTPVKDDGTLSYVWYASSTRTQKTLSDADIIEGATSSSLTLTNDQVGKYIFVKVVASDGTQASGARQAGTPNKSHYGAGIVKVLEVASDLNEDSFVAIQSTPDAESSTDEVRGSLRAGCTLYANAYDGGNKFKKRIAGKDEWAYKWFAYDSQDAEDSDYGALVAEKTGDASLEIDETLAASLSGKYLRVAVCGNGCEIVGPASSWNSPGPVIGAGQIAINHVILAYNGSEFGDEVESTPRANVGDVIAASAYFLDNGVPSELYRADLIDFSWQVAAAPDAAEEDFVEVATGDTFAVSKECEGKYLRVVARAKNGVFGHDAHATEPGRILPEGASTLSSVSILNASAVTETGGTLCAQAYEQGLSGQVPVTQGVTYTWSWTSTDPYSYDFDPATDWRAIEGATASSFTIPASFVGCWVSVSAYAGDNTVSTESDYYSGAAGPFARPAQDVPETGERLAVNVKITGVTAHKAGEEFSAEAWVPLTEFSWGSSATKTAWDAFSKLLDAAGYYYDLTGGCPASITTPDGSRTLAMSANAPWSYWSFIVNGQYAQTMPNSYMLKDGDSIELMYVDATGVEVAPSEEVVVNPDAAHPDLGSDWEGFAKGSFGSVVSDVPSAVENGTLSWEYSLLTDSERESGAYPSVSDPIIVGGNVYLVYGSTTYDSSWKAVSSLAKIAVIDPATGAVVRQATLGTSMDSTCRPVYADGIVVVPLSNGSLQAVSASTLETLWFSKGILGAQMLSTLTVKDGYVYAASADALDASSYKASAGTLKRLNLLTGAVSGVQASETSGYYWAGGLCVGDYFVIADDAGDVSVYSADLSQQVDTLSLGASVRSSLVEDNGFLYAVSSDGVLHELFVGEDGSVSETNRMKFAEKSTSTATIEGGFAYVGAALSGGSGALCVVSLASGEVTQITKASGDALPGEVKSAPLVSKQDDGVYVYFTCNGAKGTWPAYTAGGGVYCYRSGDDSAISLYEPQAGRVNLSMASVVAGADGSLFYTNDSGYLFKIAPRKANSPDPGPNPDPGPGPNPGPGPDEPVTPDKPGESQDTNNQVKPGANAGQGGSASSAAGLGAQESDGAGEGAEGNAEAAEAAEAAGDEDYSIALLSADSMTRSADAGADGLSASSDSAGFSASASLNPLAVCGIAVGVLVLLALLLWLVLARRNRDGADEGAGASSGADAGAGSGADSSASSDADSGANKDAR